MDNLKEEFISSFGKEKYEEEVEINLLFELENEIANYLGIEPLPIIVDNINGEARLYPNEGYIVISEKIIKDHIRSVDAVIHELRHWYQINVIAYNIEEEKQFRQWKKEYEKLKTHNKNERNLQIEIDAYAFSKFIISKILAININYKDESYNKKLNNHINTFFNIEN